MWRLSVSSYPGSVVQAVVVQKHPPFLPSEPPQVPLKLLWEKRTDSLNPNVLLLLPLVLEGSDPAVLKETVLVSYPGAGPAQQSKGVTVPRRRHQVHSHRPPAPAVPLEAVEAPLHPAGLQPQDQETLSKVVHGLEAVGGQLGQVEGGSLVVTVEQETLERGGRGSQQQHFNRCGGQRCLSQLPHLLRQRGVDVNVTFTL